MAIDFTKTFGSKPAAAAGNNAKSDDRPKAEFWLNVGYQSDAIDPETGERRFVSLPTGIPLDTQEKLDTRMKNRDYANFQAARNGLLDDLLEQAKKLDPGQSFVVETEIGLAIQVRRVNPVLEEANAGEGNQYARKLFASA